MRYNGWCRHKPARARICVWWISTVINNTATITTLIETLTQSIKAHNTSTSVCRLQFFYKDNWHRIFSTLQLQWHCRSISDQLLLFFLFSQHPKMKLNTNNGRRELQIFCLPTKITTTAFCAHQRAHRRCCYHHTYFLIESRKKKTYYYQK